MRSADQLPGEEGTVAGERRDECSQCVAARMRIQRVNGRHASAEPFDPLGIVDSRDHLASIVEAGTSRRGVAKGSDHLDGGQQRSHQGKAAGLTQEQSGIAPMGIEFHWVVEYRRNIGDTLGAQRPRDGLPPSLDRLRVGVIHRQRGNAHQSAGKE